MPKAPASRFKAEVLKMLANGQTAAYIANALGISENIIYRWKSMNRDDFYGLSKGWPIIFVIFFPPTHHRTDPVN